MGCTAVVMPENYIAMFDVPTQKESLEIIQRAEQTINEAILTIKNGKGIFSARSHIPGQNEQRNCK